MNLKEAFRYQNKLQSLIDEAEMVLRNPSVTTTVQDTYLYSRVECGALDETVIRDAESEYSGQINQMVDFALCLLAQKENLAGQIHLAKMALPIDLDAEISLNAKRQSVARALEHMDGLKGTEQVIRGGGTGFRFNVAGDQVAYKCDIKRVIQINFDRNAVRNRISTLRRKADSISTQIDQCMVNSEVAFEEPFDVNDSFSNIFASYCASNQFVPILRAVANTGSKADS
ncbi:MAG: hypothetical protein LUG93_10205 [Lachnospiraceae bacterium]|nr:hypothetical protein [Lachnospiraceae bacterium]